MSKKKKNVKDKRDEQLKKKVITQKENIKDRETRVHPSITLYPLSIKKYIIDQLKGKKMQAIPTETFNKEFPQEFNMEIFKEPSISKMTDMSLRHDFFDDIGAGLWSAFTSKEDQFLDIKPLRDENNDIVMTIFTLSYNQLKKFALGRLVNKNGYGKKNTGNITKQIMYKYITPVLKGDVSPPLSLGSVKIEDVGVIAIIGYPLQLRGFNNKKEVLQITMDHAFFPLKRKEIKTGVSFIRQIPAPTAFMYYGINRARERFPDITFPDAKFAIRILKTSQAIFEVFGGFVKGAYYKRIEESGDIEIIINTKDENDYNIMENLCPGAISKKSKKVNYKVFTENINKLGIAFKEAAQDTELELSEKDILIPCEDSARYSSKTKKVYIVYKCSPFNINIPRSQCLFHFPIAI